MSFGLVTAALLGVWVLLTGATEPGQLLFGVLLAAAVAMLMVGLVRRRLGPQLRPLDPDAGPLRRLWAVLRRLWVLLRWLRRLAVDIVVANFRIAALVLDPARRPQPVLLELPLRLQSPLGIYLLAATVSLTPGTLTVAPPGPGARRLLIHAIDGSSVATAGKATAAGSWANAVKARYEDPLLEVFR